MTNPTDLFNQLNAASELESLRERDRVATALLTEAKRRIEQHRNNEDNMSAQIADLEEEIDVLRQVVHAKVRLSRRWWQFWQ